MFRFRMFSPIAKNILVVFGVCWIFHFSSCHRVGSIFSGTRLLLAYTSPSGSQVERSTYAGMLVVQLPEQSHKFVGPLDVPKSATLKKTIMICLVSGFDPSKQKNAKGKI